MAGKVSFLFLGRAATGVSDPIVTQNLRDQLMYGQFSATAACSAYDVTIEGSLVADPQTDDDWAPIARWEWTSGATPTAGRGEQDVSFDGLDSEGLATGDGTGTPRDLLVGSMPATLRVRARLTSITGGAVTLAVTEF